METPGFTEFAPWKSLSGGDYDQLEKSIYESGAGRLAEDRGTAEARFLASMRKIGMADDPTTQQLLKETVTTPYTRALTDLASNASAQRYGLESTDLNAFNLGQTERGNALNQYNLSTYTLPRDYYLKQMGLFYQPSTAITSKGESTGSGYGYSLRGGSQGFKDIMGGIGGMGG